MRLAVHTMRIGFLSLILSIPFLVSCSRLDAQDDKSRAVAPTKLIAISETISAKEGVLPKNYMMEKYGVSEPFYCDLEDPVEEIACMAWDAALGRQINSMYSQSDFNILLAMDAINNIQNLVSSPRYSLYSSLKGGWKVPNDVQKTVNEKYGSCGNHQEVFEDVMDLVGIPVRRVGFYYKTRKHGRASHATSEILISGKWRHVDTTWGSFWFQDPNVLDTLASVEDLLGRPSQFTRVTNSLDIWYGHQPELNRDPFAYLETDGHIGVIIGEEGVIEYDPVLGLQHVPAYLGALNSNHVRGLSVRWKTSMPNTKNISLSLSVSGVGGCSSNGPILVDQNDKEYPLQQGMNRVNIPNGSLFNVKRNPGEVCYVTFNDVKVLD